MALHGNGNTADAVRNFWGLREEADRLGFVVVFPNGTFRKLDNNCCGWNDGRALWGDQTPPDDIAFFTALFDFLPTKYPVDAKRVYLAGWSNGGFMSFRIACELSDRIAGVASGSGPRDDTACQIARPLPIMVIHGTADPLEPYAGGRDFRGLTVPAVTEVADFWRKHDGCPTDGTVTMLTQTVEQRSYGGCQAGSEVVLITVTGGGHCWFGAQCGAGSPGDPNFKATPAVVQFLLAH